jgi:hypothetical protein
MGEFMKNLTGKDIGYIILAGIVVAVISQILNTLEAFATMNIYLADEYFPVWSRIMMPAAGPPPASFYVYSILFSLIAGIIYAGVFFVLEDGIPGREIRKGLYYGLILFLVSGIPFLLTTYLLINLPSLFFVAGTIFGFIGYILSGLVINGIVGGR